jgi:polyphosphate kinase 2 (PPK2 family)
VLAFDGRDVVERTASTSHYSLVMAKDKAEGDLGRGVYENELFRLQTELVIKHEWVRDASARIVVIFDGLLHAA